MKELMLLSARYIVILLSATAKLTVLQPDHCVVKSLDFSIRMEIWVVAKVTFILYLLLKNSPILITTMIIIYF